MISQFSKNTPARGKSTGFISLELVLALIVVGFLAVQAYKVYASNSTSTEIRVTVDTVTAIGANLKQSFGAKNQYDKLTTDSAVRSNVIPTDMRGPDSGANATATSPAGGPVYAVPAQINASNDGGALIWDQIPVEQCSQIASQLEGSVREMGLVTAGTAAPSSVNLAASDAATLKDSTGVGKPFDVAAASTECESIAAGGDNVEMIFVFGRN